MATSETNILNTYSDYLADIGKSPSTIRAYLFDLRDFQRWYEQTAGEAFDPQAPGPRDIVDYRGFMMTNGKKPATVNRRLVALQCFAKWALRQGYITASPFEMLENVRVKQQAGAAPKWLNRKEQLSLLRAVRKGRSVRDLAIVELMLKAGLRVSEVANLTLDDIALSERSGLVIIRSGKGQKYRELPLANEARQALASYLVGREDYQSDRFFIGQRGPLNVPGIQYLISKYAYQARLEDVTPHTLRHTFGKNLVDESVSLDQVATLLGHESLDTVMIYTRPSADDLDRAVRKAAGEVIQT